MFTLNYAGATALRGAAQFGPGTGRVWLSQVACTLNDSSLANCSYSVSINANLCGHNRDAGVICFTEFGNSRRLRSVIGLDHEFWPMQGHV